MEIINLEKKIIEIFKENQPLNSVFKEIKSKIIIVYALWCVIEFILFVSMCTAVDYSVAQKVYGIIAIIFMMLLLILFFTILNPYAKRKLYKDSDSLPSDHWFDHWADENYSKQSKTKILDQLKSLWIIGFDRSFELLKEYEKFFEEKGKKERMETHIKIFSLIFGSLFIPIWIQFLGSFFEIANNDIDELLIAVKYSCLIALMITLSIFVTRYMLKGLITDIKGKLFREIAKDLTDIKWSIEMDKKIN